MGADCEIRFENIPGNVVYGGQQVAGIVDINVHEVIKVKKLTLFIEGVGECEWRDSELNKKSHGKTTRQNTYYRGKDQYLNSISDLIPNETEIQPGRHTYNFLFQVPPGAPSSVQERHGKIFYRVRVVFDRPWKFNIEFKHEFTVIQQLDLNFDPQLRIPLQEEAMKHYCCWCCVSEPVILTASIQQSGFAAGEKIPIKVAINNPSNVDINHVEFILEKHTTYTSDLPSFKQLYGEIELYKMVHGSSFSRCKKEYNIDLEVPPTVPSTYSPLVKVIKIHYKLKIKAKTPGCHMSPSIVFPITIGTVGIGKTGEPNAPNIASMVPPSAPMNNDFSNIMMAPSAPSDLPPSFNEATKLMHSVNAEINASYNNSPQIGFVVPSNDFKKA